MRLPAFRLAAMLATPAYAALAPGSTTTVAGRGDSYDLNVRTPEGVFLDTYSFSFSSEALATNNGKLRFKIAIFEDPAGSPDGIGGMDGVLVEGPGVSFTPTVFPFAGCCGPARYQVGAREAGTYNLNIRGFAIPRRERGYFGAVEIVTPLPAAGVLLAAALGALGIARRRVRAPLPDSRTTAGVHGRVWRRTPQP